MRPHLVVSLCILMTQSTFVCAATGDDTAGMTKLAMPDQNIISSPTDPAHEPGERDDVISMVQRLLAEPFETDATAEDLDAARTFYTQTRSPLWINGSTWSPAAVALIDELKRADDWGLDPAAFHIPELLPESDNEIENLPVLADAEMRLSLAALKYARYARGGRIPDPSALLSAYIDRKPQIVPPLSVLVGLAQTDHPDRYLRDLNPRQPQFEQLRQQYLAIRDGTKARIPKVPEQGDMLFEGAAHPDIAVVRRRLGVAADEGAAADLYDGALYAAVKSFQRKKGLYADGIIGPQTRRALNEGSKVSPETILANMEEWRWMPDPLGETYVWVNVPEFLVRVVEDGKIVHTAAVVVGKKKTQTPLFSQALKTVYFRPRWYIPDSIKLNEILPRLRNGGGSGYEILRNGRKISRGSVRWSRADVREYVIYQPSGSGNALGLVKFTFPNRHSVYMHDTPAKGLFSEDVRAFSHGCIRVQNPAKLANVVLGIDQNMSPKEVVHLMDDGPDNHPVALQKPIPVHIVYFTAWVDENGQLDSAPDIYGHEKRITLALQGKWDQIEKNGPEELDVEKAEARDAVAAKPERRVRTKVRAYASRPARRSYVSQASSGPAAPSRGSTANDVFRRNFGN
jgi:murein L,D-transpeptidase YcbB/YkuD